MKKNNDMADKVIQQEHSNNKCYALTCKYI